MELELNSFATEVRNLRAGINRKPVPFSSIEDNRQFIRITPVSPFLIKRGIKLFKVYGETEIEIPQSEITDFIEFVYVDEFERYNEIEGLYEARRDGLAL